ncbi:MAG: DUF4173 domain-containing protein [Clostridiales bacterium]|nr:DUF4173 domain-containing protein [Clostridiales bacterium]
MENFSVTPEQPHFGMPARQPFQTRPGEQKALLGSYLLAYLYVWTFFCYFSSDTIVWQKIGMVCFSCLLCLATAWVFHGEKASKECYVWLACTAVILISILAGRGRVWSGYGTVFLHAYAVYWILVRSGRLMEGESGGFLPLDVLNGFIIFPFHDFFLRIRVLFSRSETEKEANRKNILPVLLAVAASVVLLYLAGSLLRQADKSFRLLLDGMLGWIRLPRISEFIFRLILSLPVGAYLYGLLFGTARRQPEKLKERAGMIRNSLTKLRKVPETAWSVLLLAFCLLYLLFFVIQGTYIFGAFSQALPEGFTVARYARQGFFELCRVMALNLLLLWIVTRSSQASVRQNKPLLTICTVLLGESLLLAVTAFSKIFLYISCFGFTPLRLQSAWLVSVLFALCIAVLVSLWSGKKTANAWVLFAGVTLALLNLY